MACSPFRLTKVGTRDNKRGGSNTENGAVRSIDNGIRYQPSMDWTFD
jgi:hypothetical protein